MKIGKRHKQTRWIFYNWRVWWRKNRKCWRASDSYTYAIKWVMKESILTGIKNECQWNYEPIRIVRLGVKEFFQEVISLLHFKSHVYCCKDTKAWLWQFTSFSNVLVLWLVFSQHFSNSSTTTLFSRTDYITIYSHFNKVQFLVCNIRRTNFLLRLQPDLIMMLSH